MAKRSPRPKADPLFSAGARLERRAHHDRLVRRIKVLQTERAKVSPSNGLVIASLSGAINNLILELAWNTTRWERYASRPGGLGRDPQRVKAR